MLLLTTLLVSKQDRFSPKVIERYLAKLSLLENAKAISREFSNIEDAFTYIKSKFESAKIGANRVDFPEFGFELDADQVVEMIGLVYETFLSSNDQLSRTKQKNLGVYYTDRSLADLLIKDMCDQFESGKIPKFLEPSAGLGAFVFAYLRYQLEAKLPGIENDEKWKQQVLNSIYIVEKDLVSGQALQWLIRCYLASKFADSLIFKIENLHIGDAIIEEESGLEKDLFEKFDLNSKFDMIASNPPYRLLKASRTDSAEFRIETENLGNLVRRTKYFSDISGVNNLYKIFICKIFYELSSSDASIGLVIPRSLLTDNQSSKLRRALFNESLFGNIYDIPEGSDFFRNIGQAFSVFSTKKGSKTETIKLKILGNKNEISNSNFQVRDIDFYRGLSPNISIVPFTPSDEEFVNKLAVLPKVKNVQQIVNLRGELDMTLDKKFIVEENTENKFIQGSDIALFKIRNTSKYVSDDFFPRGKDKWTKLERIACQQISNANQVRRLKWSFVPANYVLANSCNFIAIDNESLFQKSEPVLNSYLLAVFNSEFMNRWFKIFSANNHISNQEIANMPLVIPTLGIQKEIGLLSNQLVNNFSQDLHHELESRLVSIFGI